MNELRGAAVLGKWADPRQLATLRASDARAQDKHNGIDHTRYDRSVCQCCGFKERKGSFETCLCDGLDWYQLPNGAVECQAHRFARALDKGQRKFFDLGRLLGR